MGRLDLFEARCRGSKLDLRLKNLVAYDDWKVSEESDYVYALLAITEIPQSVQQYFVVDYNKPVHEVFMDATRGVVQSSKVLSILSCVPTRLRFSVLVPKFGPGSLAVFLEHTRLRDAS